MTSPGSLHPTPRTLKLLISTGEVSGDLQGGFLIEALHRQAHQQGIALEIVALGGDRMAAAGSTLLANTTRVGSVGLLLEALPHIVPTLKNQQLVRRSLQQSPPDAVILIDYMGPNIGIGRLIRRHDPKLPTIYYIAPQEWVWSLGDRNTQAITQITDRLLAIFPQEAAYYQNQGISTQWVGHPLLDQVQSNPSRQTARHVLEIGESDPAIVLLPASRQQEMRYLLPVMLEAAQAIQAQLLAQNLARRDQTLFWIPLSLEAYRDELNQHIQAYDLQARIVPAGNDAKPEWQRRCALAAADLALTKSGTVNLELALMQVPQLVMYRVSPMTAWIAQHLLRFSIPFMSPVNLVQMQPIVPEFLQHQATADRISQAALSLLVNPDLRSRIQQGYAEMKKALGDPGACDRAAIEILKLVGETRQF
jgi:lipid-A-disaccharide synthase